MFTRRQMMGAAAALSFLASTGAGVAQDLYIPLISKGFQHQFWQAVKTGADKAGQEMGVRVSFDGPDNETQVDKQIDMLAAALANKPAAIGIAALDSQAVIPLLKKAQAEGIPVIAFDSGVESDIPLATASTDNKAAAALAADKLGEMIGGKGKVAVVAHNQTSLTGIDRRDGFLDQMKSRYPEVEVVAVEYGDGDHLKSTEITKAILAANADIKGIFGTNEGSAVGVLNGVREMGAKVVVVGFDSGKAQKDAIREGVMAGAITQNPVGIGYETVKAAVAASKGETLPKTIDTGFYWYDKTNIDDPAIAAVLYD
ncbi:ABC transporter substrate-binding protein [Paracoccus salipaludis]|uniref:BMP family ABC transporter substrate-binding protein n=1 Tax=Paracoccus salipaludis TaxID=2032623 RepID=A0A2A2GH62_9RHOB|nr:ABC transporter substrate-binding protein [Paracoccus salipaludis]PAU96233.1 BMP family ABC transporter substrate-binding protein [Paracoccus salipaludis]